jgi:hypothetical protein
MVTGLASWVPEELDLERPSGARVCDYLLGGGHNFAHDRELAERMLHVQPHAREIVRLNRAFLRRAVLFMVESGVRQFLDLGSGIPTVGNVHEIAQKADPRARVVYVDDEEVAIAHSELILEHNHLATVVRADEAEAGRVLDHASGLLDFGEPVGLLAVGGFQSVGAEPWRVLAAYRDLLRSGSYLGLSHVASDMMPREVADVVEVMKGSRDPLFPRSHAEITALFDGFDIVEPGVVPTSSWRPEAPYDINDEPGRSGMYAGVGRKP